MSNSAFISSSPSRCTATQKTRHAPLMHKTINYKLHAAFPSSLPSLDLSISQSNFIEAPSFQISTITSGVEPVQSFEPVVNVPALSSFMLIVVVFGFLQLRINAIGKAVNRRTEALEYLRRVKAKQLSFATNSNDPNDSDTLVAEINSASEEYRMALIEEKNARTIIPGVRIAAPNRQIRVMKMLLQPSCSWIWICKLNMTWISTLNQAKTLPPPQCQVIFKAVATVIG